MTRWVTLLILAGCTTAPEAFPARYADAYCARSRACDPEGHGRRYEDGPGCRVVTADHVFGLLGGADRDCPFDEDIGETCIADVREATCDALDAGGFSAACDQVMSACFALDGGG